MLKTNEHIWLIAALILIISGLRPLLTLVGRTEASPEAPIRALSASAAQNSLPPSSRRYGRLETQRIYFKNTPLFRKAEQAVARNDDAAAVRAFQEILRNDPGNNSAKLALIALYDRLGQYDRAGRLAAELSRQYPDFTDLYWTRGHLAMKRGRFAQAIAAWEEGLQRAPADFPRRDEIRLSQARADFFDSNYRSCVSRLALIPGQPPAAQLFMGFAFLKWEMPGLALASFNAIDDPAGLTAEEQLSLYRNRAYLNFDQHQYAEAAEDAETALAMKLAPDMALLHLQAYAGQGDYEIVETNALRLLDKKAPGLALSSNEQAQVNLVLGRCRYQQKQYAAAVRAFQEILRNDPGNNSAKLALIALYDRLGQYDRAGRLAAELSRQYPDFTDLYWTRGHLAVKRGRFAQAIAAWEEGLQRAPADFPRRDEIRLSQARADFFDSNYRSCVSRLALIPGQPPAAQLFMGFAFLKWEMPGLALASFNAIDDPAGLTAEEQLSLYRNRAYLNFDQHQYAEAAEDAETALAMKLAPDMALLHLQAYAGQGDYEIVETNALRLLGKKAPGLALSSNEQAQVNLVLGRCRYQQKQYAAAVSNLTQALQADPALWEGYYLRGLAFYALGQARAATNDYRQCLRLETNPPAVFWGDFGQAAGGQKEYKEGTAALARALEYHSADVATRANQGYQFMKWSHNREARQAFQRAIDLYADLVPRVPTNETAVYRRGAAAMKQEYTKLDHLFGIEGYFSKQDYDFPADVGIAPVAGALPSQYGLGLSLRPPVIGFRDEKTLDVFGNFFGNFERRSWTPERDSYQGMAGLRYKPLARLNFNTSFARLMKIGDNSENNWLWRNMAAWERGEKPAPGKSVGANLKLFGDAGYYFAARQRWYGYLDGRAGPAWQLRQNAFLAMPHVMGILRGETNDDSDTGSYGLAGLGGLLRLFEPERRYTINRLYVDIFAYYTVGRFAATPAGFDGPSFNGLIFGMNLLK